MRIAVIGGGISGMVAAYILCRDHDITLFESEDRIGGHTHTVTVREGGRALPVDTGFIVFNDWTYPNFCKLIDRLGVAWQYSDMSFSVTSRRSGLEYQGSSLGGLFAQRANLLRPSFYRMLADILRFNRHAKALADAPGDELPLAEFVRRHRYGRAFIENYLVPMGSAIWSADPAGLNDFPARYMAGFYKNHGMLNIRHRPRWRVIQGGSCRYIEPLTAPYRERIRLGCRVGSVTRADDHVEIRGERFGTERFDAVILACHSDQALALLSDPSQMEREILGAIPYQANETVLHTDTSILPKRRRAWAAWNYLIPENIRGRATLTYNMNVLQTLPARKTYCVSLNSHDLISPAETLRAMTYHHPVYTLGGVRAQQKRDEINGVRRTWFCGAYWGYGFHEDGVNSALAVCRDFGKSL
ncbi:MAG: FAD-dependent oxidoreductase [Planctomycetota bacterium]|nr:MAG: FAD-dependent oxidoreductase [Planctomycetota bacterium]